MGKMTLIIRDEKLEHRFRVRAVERFGGKKGALAKAASEAFELWLKQRR